jgi:hypothetical protein
MWKTILFGAFSLMLLIGVSPAMVGAMVGGLGGSPFVGDCGTDAVLVGIKGRAGLLLDRIQAECVRVNNQGKWGGNFFTKGPYGGQGGAPFSFRCPQDSAVRRATVTYGPVPYIVSISVGCSDLNSNGTVSALFVGGSATYGPQGALNIATTPGRQSKVFECPPDKPMSGISGRAATYVDRFGVICRSPVVVQFTASPPQHLSPVGGAAAGPRPTFTWSGVPGATSYSGNVIKMVYGQPGELAASFNSTSTSHTLTNDLPIWPGGFAWTVRACNSLGACTGFRPRSQFTR